MDVLNWHVQSVDALTSVAAGILSVWPPERDRAWVMGLVGPLGAGKTALVKYIGAHLGVGDVTSPTFDLIHTHWTPDGHRLVHLDLYRLQSEGAVLGLDLDYYWDDPSTLIVIEWPERLPLGYTPDHGCWISQIGNDRQITFHPWEGHKGLKPPTHSSLLG